MSETVDPSRMHRALDVANGIVLSARPKHAAIKASANDVVDLACALVALGNVASLAAAYLDAQETALDATELPLDTIERFEASEKADAAVGDTHDDLAKALAAYGYLTLKDPEKTDGSAD